MLLKNFPFFKIWARRYQILKLFLNIFVSDAFHNKAKIILWTFIRGSSPSVSRSTWFQQLLLKSPKLEVSLHHWLIIDSYISLQFCIETDFSFNSSQRRFPSISVFCKYLIYCWVVAFTTNHNSIRLLLEFYKSFMLNIVNITKSSRSLTTYAKIYNLTHSNQIYHCFHI